MSDTSKPKETRDFEVKLSDVRLSFSNIFVPQKNKKDPNAEPKFNCNFLMSKTTPEGRKVAEEISKAMKAAGDAKWGAGKWSLKPDKKCLRDGDLETYEGYKGMYYCSASNSRKPKVMGRSKEPLTQADGKPYSGCYVNAIIRIWAQDNEHGRRINASLEGVQFVRDGEAFGARPLDDDAFDALDDDGLSDDGESGGDSLLD